jgi:uncharacterized protein (TIGR02246 family)
MRNISRLAGQLLSIAALGLCSFGASAAGSGGDVAALHAVDQAWVKAFNSNDPEAVAKLYDENAILFPPGAPPAKGRAAIRATLAKEMAGAAKDGISFALDPKPDGGVSGNMGWVSGTYTVKDKSGKVLDVGKYLSVSTKKGGKWMYIRDTWNSDGPPAPEPAKK